MTESILLPGQPYAGLPGWEDLSGIVSNGWGVTHSSTYLIAQVVGNTAHLKGRLTVGDDTSFGVLPRRLLPRRPVEEPAFSRAVRAGVEISVWGNGALVLPLSSFPTGTTLESLRGSYYSFTISYPRRAQ